MTFLWCKTETPRPTWRLYWPIQGQPDRSRAFLQPVFGRFTEGFDAADLKIAERLLAAF
jgi:hypothetical protein